MILSLWLPCTYISIDDLPGRVRRLTSFRFYLISELRIVTVSCFDEKLAEGNNLDRDA
jgi:hypothetical protein